MFSINSSCLLNNRGDYKVGNWICEFEFRRRYKFRSHQYIDFFYGLDGKINLLCLYLDEKEFLNFYFEI